MKSINTQNNKTSHLTFELITNSKRSNWNSKRRYSNLTQIRFI